VAESSKVQVIFRKQVTWLQKILYGVSRILFVLISHNKKVATFTY